MIKALRPSGIWKGTKHMFFGLLLTFHMNFNKNPFTYFAGKLWLSHNLLRRGNDNLPNRWGKVAVYTKFRGRFLQPKSHLVPLRFRTSSPPSLSTDHGDKRGHSFSVPNMSWVRPTALLLSYTLPAMKRPVIFMSNLQEEKWLRKKLMKNNHNQSIYTYS